MLDSNKFYPHKIEVSGKTYQGQINNEKMTLLTKEVGILDVIKSGDTIYQELRGQKIPFIVKSFNELGQGTSLHHAKISFEKDTDKNIGNVNIGNITGENVQIGNNNEINVSFHELVKQIADSDDTEAKKSLKELLKNKTVSSIVGEGIKKLFAYI